MPPIIRHAKPEEVTLLSDLALVSKASWGYDTDFIEACREDLTISEEMIRERLTFVAEQDARPVGFYRLAETSDGPYLKDLFVLPETMGQGIGKQLLQHAIEQAKTLKWTSFLLESDPYAENFYHAQGAKRIGEVPSTSIQGRMLPVMRLDLS